MKKICRYVLESYRSADLEGVFILTDEELAMIKEMNGTEVYYGEVSGKHSEVTADLNIDDVEILSEDEKEVEFFERILPLGAGFGFKEYWFSTDQAYESGWSEGESGEYENVKLALKARKEYDNGVMRNAFSEGFKNGIESRKEKNE